MINCPECGAENQPEASFCAECGAELTVQPAAADVLPPVEPGLSNDDATILSSRRELEEALAKARSESAPPAVLEPDFSDLFAPSSPPEPESMPGRVPPAAAPEAEPISEMPPPPLVEPKKSNRLFTVLAAVLAAILSCPCICGVIVTVAYISDSEGFEDLVRGLLGGSF